MLSRKAPMTDRDYGSYFHVDSQGRHANVPEPGNCAAFTRA